MTTPDPSREAFGKHVLTENGIFVRGLGWLNRDETGAYQAPEIQARWLTWQAAMAHKEAEGGGAQNSLESPQSLMDTGSEVVPANDWQPIATAPKDGTVVLLAHPKGRMADGCHHSRYGVWSWPYVMLEPTHWQPLPEAPRQEGKAHEPV